MIYPLPTEPLRNKLEWSLNCTILQCFFLFLFNKTKTFWIWRLFYKINQYQEQRRVAYLRHFPHIAALVLSITSRHWSQLPMELNLVGFLIFSSCITESIFSITQRIKWKCIADNKENNDDLYLQSIKLWRINFQWFRKVVFITDTKNKMIITGFKICLFPFYQGWPCECTRISCMCMSNLCVS
jgi:hypothetical protein